MYRRDLSMKRTAVIAGMAAVVLVLGILAFVHRPGFAFAHPPGIGMMGGPGGHAMGPMMMSAGTPPRMGAGAAGCPVATMAALTPEQQQERAKTFVEHYIQQFLPGYTLEKKA